MLCDVLFCDLCIMLCVCGVIVCVFCVVLHVSCCVTVCFMLSAYVSVCDLYCMLVAVCGACTLANVIGVLYMRNPRSVLTGLCPVTVV